MSPEEAKGREDSYSDGMNTALLSVPVSPSWEGFLRCLRREGTPDRVYFIELLIDEEIRIAVA